MDGESMPVDARLAGHPIGLRSRCPAFAFKSFPQAINSLESLTPPSQATTIRQMRWQERAACKGSTHWFFPVEGESESEKHERVAYAKTICLRCPVRTECLDDALRTVGHEGIRAGKTPRELRSMRSSYLKELAKAQ